MADVHNNNNNKTNQKNKHGRQEETNYSKTEKSYKNNDSDSSDKEEEDQLHIIINNQKTLLQKFCKMEENYDNVIRIIKALEGKYSTLESNLSILKEDVNGVIVSQGHLNDMVESQKKEIAELKKTVNNIVLDNKNLKSENTKLHNKMDRAQFEICKGNYKHNDLEQYGRRDMVDIAGIPRGRNEDTDKIAIKVGELMGITITNDDIAISHRVSTKPNAPIIVKFVSRRKRNLFFDNRKKLKDFRVKDLEMVGDCKNKIYINESLTPANSAVFREAKYCLGGTFEFIWTHNGVTFVKQNKTSTKMFIRSIGDVRNIMERFDIGTGNDNDGGIPNNDNGNSGNVNLMQSANSNNNDWS